MVMIDYFIGLWRLNNKTYCHSRNLKSFSYSVPGTGDQDQIHIFIRSHVATVDTWASWNEQSSLLASILSNHLSLEAVSGNTLMYFKSPVRQKAPNPCYYTTHSEENDGSGPPKQPTESSHPLVTHKPRFKKIQCTRKSKTYICKSQEGS